jgi:hypothetical protein
MPRLSARILATLAHSAAIASLLGACSDSATAPVNTLEPATRITLTLTPVNGGSEVISFIDDPDGPGPQSATPQSAPIAVLAGATYTGTVRVENHRITPPSDVSPEIVREGDEHRVYYTVFGMLTGAGFVFTPTDMDRQGRPIGLQFRAVVHPTVGGESGSIQVVVCHYARAAKDASSSACQGGIDIAARFQATATD